MISTAIRYNATLFHAEIIVSQCRYLSEIWALIKTY